MGPHACVQSSFFHQMQSTLFHTSTTSALEILYRLVTRCQCTRQILKNVQRCRLGFPCQSFAEYLHCKFPTVLNLPILGMKKTFLFTMIRTSRASQERVSIEAGSMYDGGALTTVACKWSGCTYTGVHYKLEELPMQVDWQWYGANRRDSMMLPHTLKLHCSMFTQLYTFPIHIERQTSAVSLPHRPPAQLPCSVTSTLQW